MGEASQLAHLVFYSFTSEQAVQVPQYHHFYAEAASTASQLSQAGHGALPYTGLSHHDRSSANLEQITQANSALLAPQLTASQLTIPQLTSSQAHPMQAPPQDESTPYLQHVQSSRRPLTGFETFFHETARLNQNDTIAGYRVHLARPAPSRAQMLSILHALKFKHRGLQASIVRRDNLLWFESKPEAPLAHYTALKSDQSWQSVMTSQLAQTIDPVSDPLIRFVALEHHNHSSSGHNTTDLLAIAHHSAIDAIGMIGIFKDLFIALETPLRPAFDPVAAPDSIALASLPPTKLPAYRYLHLLDYMMTNLVYKPVFSKLKTSQRLFDLQTSSHVLSLQATNAFIHATKQQSATVYSGIAAAAITTAREFFPKRCFGQLITTASPVSLRHHGPQQSQPERLGCHISLLVDRFPTWQRPKSQSTHANEAQDSPTALWALARHARNKTHRHLQKGHHHILPKLFDRLYERGWQGEPRQHVGSPDTLIINNLGRHQLAPDQVQAFHWMSLEQQMTPGASVNFVTMNDQLNLVISSRRLPAQQFIAFQEQLIAHLHAMARF